jgi:hypothetical protein
VWRCSSSTGARKLRGCVGGRSIGCGVCYARSASCGTCTSVCWSTVRPRLLRPATGPRDCRAVSVLACDGSRRGGFSEYFSASDTEISRGQELDFILRFAFGIVRGEILLVPRYGVWSFHHDDEMRYRGGSPAFWWVSTHGRRAAASHRGAGWRSGPEKARFRYDVAFVHQKSRCGPVRRYRFARGGLSRSPDRRKEYLDDAPSTSTAPRTDLSRPRVTAKCCASQ